MLKLLTLLKKNLKNYCRKNKQKKKVNDLKSLYEPEISIAFKNKSFQKLYSTDRFHVNQNEISKNVLKKVIDEFQHHAEVSNDINVQLRRCEDLLKCYDTKTLIEMKNYLEEFFDIKISNFTEFEECFRRYDCFVSDTDNDIECREVKTQKSSVFIDCYGRNTARKICKLQCGKYLYIC